MSVDLSCYWKLGYALIEAYFNLGGAKSEAWFPEDEEWGLQGLLPSRDPGPARALGLPFGSRRLCPLWSGMRSLGVLAQMPAVSLWTSVPWTLPARLLARVSQAV